VVKRKALSTDGLSRHLKIEKDRVYDIAEHLVNVGVVEAQEDGTFKVIIDAKHEIHVAAIKDCRGLGSLDLTKHLEDLFDARAMNQSTDEERAKKCELILGMINKSRDEELTMLSPEVADRQTFPILVTKVPHSNFGIVFATPDHGGIKLGHIMYVAYEEKWDEKLKKKYRGMVSNPYSEINWTVHQARLKVIGWGPDGVPFKEARKHGVFAPTNLTEILPMIHAKMKELWKPPVMRIEPLALYYFQSATHDHTNDEGIRFVHEPNNPHSVLYENGERRGLAGGKTITTRYKHRDSKTKDLKTSEREIILTDWIPDDPNLPFNVWQARATDHVVELSQIQPTS
jgi:hypothetical protein